MTHRLDAVTPALARLALDAAALRHAALAHNIANAGTPGFVRTRVSFESQLGELRAALQDGAPLEAGLLRGVRPTLERETHATANGAATLDLEAAALAENTLQYQALLKALNKHYALLSSAINEGKQ